MRNMRVMLDNEIIFRETLLEDVTFGMANGRGKKRCVSGRWTPPPPREGTKGGMGTAIDSATMERFGSSERALFPPPRT